MSKLSELAYDIEQLWIEGHSPKMIAMILECPLHIVSEWIAENSLDGSEEAMDPKDLSLANEVIGMMK